MARNARWTVPLVALALGVPPVGAQIPDDFKNLQLLPGEIGKRELVDVMRGFAGALGVRCTHCHPGPTSGELEGVDFASDELETKKVARAMMRMTDEINGKLLPATGRRSLTRVRCVTCHRGVTEPEPLDEMLAAIAERSGAGSAAARYDELRRDYYGTAAYDFSAGTLNAVAERLAQEKDDLDGAIMLLELNLRHNPNAAPSHLLLGQIHAQKGDKSSAIASVRRAIELEPDNRWAKRMLQRLEAGD